MNQTANAGFVSSLPIRLGEGDPGATGKAAENHRVALLQNVFRAIAGGDLGAFREAMTPDAEMEILGHPCLPMCGRWVGRDEVLAAAAANFALLENQMPEIDSVVAQGDMVVIFARETGRFKPTGKDYSLRYVQLFVFDGDRISRMREYLDLTGALEPWGCSITRPA